MFAIFTTFEPVSRYFDLDLCLSKVQIYNHRTEMPMKKNFVIGF